MAVSDFAAADEIFIITINPGQTVMGMIEAGGYDDVHPAILDEAESHLLEEGETEVACRLVHLGEELSTDAVLAELRKRGVKRARTALGLSFGSSQPERQRQFPIAVLRSYWDLTSHASAGALYLDAQDGRRRLDRFLLDEGVDFPANCRFSLLPSEPLRFQGINGSVSNRYGVVRDGAFFNFGDLHSDGSVIILA